MFLFYSMWQETLEYINVIPKHHVLESIRESLWKLLWMFLPIVQNPFLHHVQQIQYSELLNIMTLRGMPRSLYSMFSRQVLSLSPARDFTVFIEISLSPPTWNCTFKPLSNCNWGGTTGHSLWVVFATKNLWAPRSWPPAGNSQVKIKQYFKWAATGTLPFHMSLCSNHTMISLAAASFPEVFWDWPPGRTEQFSLCLSLLIHQ